MFAPLRSIAVRLALAGAVPALAGTAMQPPPPRSPTRWLVKLADGTPIPTSFSAARRLFGGWWRLDAGGLRGGDLLEELAATPGVLRIERDRTYRLDLPGPAAAMSASSPPRGTIDPLFVEQWHHHRVQAETAWQRSTGDGVLVAIVDSGVTPGGPDGFCFGLAGEYDAVRDEEGQGEASDLIGHGTFVASVVAECAGNGVGAAGLASGARILAIRACTADGDCASSDVAAAIDWATSHGARVVNLSLGMPCGGEDWPACSTSIENDAIGRAAAAGVTIVANAGNGAEDHLGFPANHPEVIGVGGLDARLDKAPYSSWGTALSVTAPGGKPGADDDGDGYEDQILQETLREVCGSGPGFAYCLWSGTSFAAPHVAAAVALLLEEHPSATRGQLRRALEESALDRGAPGFDPIFGHGALQAAAALVRLDEIVAAENGDCVASATTLCLGGTRFAVEVAWADYEGGSGPGMSYPLTADSGLFWFFAPANLEILVKVVDGCDFNGFHWVYAAATTDVAYELTVTDTTSGVPKIFRNTLGTASPAFTDSSAFPCTPGGNPSAPPR